MSLLSNADTSRITSREKALLLKAVADKHGELTAELVVREADPKNEEGIAHPLAGLVGWEVEDEHAALRWRMDQARAVIRSVEPELIQLGVFQLKAPYYVHDPAKPRNEQGYVPLLTIKSHEDVAADALQAETERAVSALERAFSIAQALGLQESASELLAALGALGRAPAALAAAVLGDGALAQGQEG